MTQRALPNYLRTNGKTGTGTGTSICVCLLPSHRPIGLSAGVANSLLPHLEFGQHRTREGEQRGETAKQDEHDQDNVVAVVLDLGSRIEKQELATLHASVVADRVDDAFSCRVDPRTLSFLSFLVVWRH